MATVALLSICSVQRSACRPSGKLQSVDESAPAMLSPGATAPSGSQIGVEPASHTESV